MDYFTDVKNDIRGMKTDIVKWMFMLFLGEIFIVGGFLLLLS